MAAAQACGDFLDANEAGSEACASASAASATAGAWACPQACKDFWARSAGLACIRCASLSGNLHTPLCGAITLRLRYPSEPPRPAPVPQPAPSSPRRPAPPRSLPNECYDTFVKPLFGSAGLTDPASGAPVDPKDFFTKVCSGQAVAVNGECAATGARGTSTCMHGTPAGCQPQLPATAPALRCASPRPAPGGPPLQRPPPTPCPLRTRWWRLRSPRSPRSRPAPWPPS